MNAEQDPMPDAVSDKAHCSAIAGFIDGLKARLRRVSARTPLPEQLEDVVRQVEGNLAAGRPRAGDLVGRFTQAATSVGMQVHSATTGDWADVVAGLLRGHQAKAVAMPPVGDGFFEAERVQQLQTRLAAEGISVSNDTDDDTLFLVDAAITGVVAAIAEDGTIVCESGLDIARGSSLIPPVHIAVVAVSQLLPDLYDYFDVLSKRAELPAHANLITGPSKTADIEGVLVTGVHGPGKVHVLLIVC